MIPGENDGPDETQRLCDWIVANLGETVPLHFTAFHPDFKLNDRPATPAATLKRARRIAIAAGIKFCYIGNVYDDEGQSTYCPSCRAVVIRRSWHSVLEYRLQENRCGCGAEIPGRFADAAARRARRRAILH
jgi:pyruvate formate lyase activating enzyme